MQTNMTQCISPRSAYMIFFFFTPHREDNRSHKLLESVKARLYRLREIIGCCISRTALNARFGGILCRCVVAVSTHRIHRWAMHNDLSNLAMSQKHTVIARIAAGRHWPSSLSSALLCVIPAMMSATLSAGCVDGGRSLSYGFLTRSERCGTAASICDSRSSTGSGGGPPPAIDTGSNTRANTEVAQSHL